MVEDEPFIGLAEVGRRAKGRQRLCRAFLPFPEPHGIQVRVAEQMQLIHGVPLI
jgi:hypothetical protein